MSGFYLMHRGWQNHPVFSDEPFSERDAWVWMIEQAAFMPLRKRAGGQIVDLRRGQLVGSVRYLADAWGWSKSRVARFLGRLENERMIGTESGTGASVITVCNYDKYQFDRDSDGTPDGTHSGTRAGQQRDTSGTNKKEVKEGNEGKELETPPSAPSPKSPRGTRLPDDWRPSLDDIAFAEQHGVPVQSTLDEFLDYWRSIPGAKGRKLDWSMTWKNRIRDIAARRNGRGNGQANGRKLSPTESLFAGAALALAERERARDSRADRDPDEPLLDGGRCAGSPTTADE